MAEKSKDGIKRRKYQAQITKSQDPNQSLKKKKNSDPKPNDGNVCRCKEDWKTKKNDITVAD